MSGFPSVAAQALHLWLVTPEVYPSSIWIGREIEVSNYAIKGTSVETWHSSELSSGASVPYLGC